jgi:hypothetical protein
MLHFKKLAVESTRISIIQFQNLPGLTSAIDRPVALGCGHSNQLL